MIDDGTYDEMCVDRRQMADVVEWMLETYTGKASQERAILLAQARMLWAPVELSLIRHPDISVRQAFLIMAETVVEETRRKYADLAARSKFTSEGDMIEETRSHLDDLYSGELATYAEPEPEQERDANGKLKRGPITHNFAGDRAIDRALSSGLIEVG